MNIESVTESELAGIELRLRPMVDAATTLEEAAQALADQLFEAFPRATVLARVYATVPFSRLPESNRVATTRMATERGAEARLAPTTPVLSLLGTHGVEADWCDRRRSRGHAGIPLIDASFVDSTPMVARLLRDLGLELTLVERWADEYSRALIGGFNGVFYVPDAATAVDTRSRLIVPAQDFVTKYHVKTVFGMGGSYLTDPAGTIIACIVFANTYVPRQKAERFSSLMAQFKSATFPRVRAGRIFTDGG